MTNSNQDLFHRFAFGAAASRDGSRSVQDSSRLARSRFLGDNPGIMRRVVPPFRAVLCALILLESTQLGRPAEEYRIRDHGLNASWIVALDELQSPGQSDPERIPHAGSLRGLTQQIEAISRQRGTPPGLVLYPVGHLHEPTLRRFLTDELLVHVSSGTEIKAIVTVTGGAAVMPVELLADHYLFRVPGPTGALEAAETLRRTPGVLSAEPQLAQQFALKLVPNDPLFSRQWQLLNIGQNAGTAGMDLHLTNVWNQYRGNGVIIGIVDDGLAYAHPDLAPNYNASLSRDFNGNDLDPAPNPATDFHGTAVSGLAAGRGDNGIGICGVAYEAGLAGLRLVAAPITDSVASSGILYSNAFIQIKNNSWGAADCPNLGSLLEHPGPLATSAFNQGTLVGRGGKGTIYVWAAGNGGDCDEDVNYDGFANSVNVFPIGAVTDHGTHASYSESGACLVGCTPSGSSGGQLLTTTDLPGNDGFNRSGVTGEISDRNYTQTFAGTSASAPLASGVIALVLQANPALNWRDVKEILLRTSTHLQPADPGWQTNGSGIAHHHQFGAGLLNADAAVQMATNWPGVGSLRTLTFSAPGLPRALPDNNPTGVTFTWNVTNAGFRAEHVTLTLSTTHTAWGDLDVTLTSPGGIQSHLASVHNGHPSYDYDNWTFNSVRHWGEQIEGTWTVHIADLAAQDVGTVDAVLLRIYGTVPDSRLSVARPAEGNSVNLTLTTRAVGWKYSIESSEDLKHWTPVANVTVPATGKVLGLDNAASAAGGQRFYRAHLLR